MRDIKGYEGLYTEKSMTNRSIQGKKNWKKAVKSRRMFTMEEVSKIRNYLVSSGKSARAVAKELGCSNTTISKILANKTYQCEL